MSETWNPDLKANPFVQDVGRKEDAKSFAQQPLMVVDHEDPDKHLIGETLAPPSLSDVKPSGAVTSTGDSTLVARSDHSHDTQAMWMIATRSGGKTCPPGETFINTLVTASGGIGWPAIAGNQIITIPREGNYLIQTLWQILRDGGGNFTNQCHFQTYYFNGGFNRISWRDGMGGSSPVYVPPRQVNFVEQFGSSIADSTQNFQFSYSHNDAVNHIVYLDYIVITRLSNYNYVP